MALCTEYYYDGRVDGVREEEGRSAECERVSVCADQLLDADCAVDAEFFGFSAAFFGGVSAEVAF
jgi:hypothetical protein